MNITMELTVGTTCPVDHVGPRQLMVGDLLKAVDEIRSTPALQEDFT